MEIQSNRFGRVVVDDDAVLTFPSGLLGFPEQARFVLVHIGPENYFFWLQSADDPNLAFVVTDPALFFRDYDIPLREEMQRELMIEDERDLRIMVICNKIGDWLTGNLLGPLLVNGRNRLAQQVVLTEKKWTTRQPLLKLASAIPLAKAG